MGTEGQRNALKNNTCLREIPVSRCLCTVLLYVSVFVGEKNLLNNPLLIYLQDKETYPFLSIGKSNTKSVKW